MSVQFDGDVAHLCGDCPAADAEALASGLQAQPHCTVDLSAAGHLHTAVVQVLFAFDAAVHGYPEDAFLAAILKKEGKDVLF